MDEQPRQDGGGNEEESADEQVSQPSIPDLTPRSFSWDANPSADKDKSSVAGQDLFSPETTTPPRAETITPPRAETTTPPRAETTTPPRAETTTPPRDTKSEITELWKVPDRVTPTAPPVPAHTPGSQGGIQPVSGATSDLRQLPPTPVPAATRTTRPSEAYRSHRRATRTIKRVEPWSILKVSLLFYTAMTLVFLLFTAILFYVGVSTGVVGNFESLIRGIGWPTFRLRAVQVFRAVLTFGVVMSIFWSAVNVFMAFIYNLISDVIGGVEVQVTDRD